MNTKRHWLKAARVEKSLSQEKLGKIVGVDITAIGKYELGKRTPHHTTAKKIAQVLGFEWTRFYDDDTQNMAGAN